MAKRKKRKYTRHPMTSDRVIGKVQAIRRKNNVAWMDILRLAFKTKPRKAKQIMTQIVANDQEITKWMARLGKGKK